MEHRHRVYETLTCYNRTVDIGITGFKMPVNFQLRLYWIISVKRDLTHVFSRFHNFFWCIDYKSQMFSTLASYALRIRVSVMEF